MLYLSLYFSELATSDISDRNNAINFIYLFIVQT